MSVLKGYRVLDCSIAMAGPFAAQRLGDLGADVVKVEPVTGEWQRHVAAGGAQGNRINVSFLSLNRNKRSLAVNLKSDDGRAIVHKLVREAPTSSSRTIAPAWLRVLVLTTKRFRQSILASFTSPCPDTERMGRMRKGPARTCCFRQ